MRLEKITLLSVSVYYFVHHYLLCMYLILFSECTVRWILNKDVGTTGHITYTNNPTEYLHGEMESFDHAKEASTWMMHSESIKETSTQFCQSNRHKVVH